MKRVDWGVEMFGLEYSLFIHFMMRVAGKTHPISQSTHVTC